MSQTQGYVLGVNPAELQRLGLQHQLWSEQAHALWERAGITTGQVVLDIGAGPGYAACDLAQIVGPDGRIHAVDEAPLFLEYLRRQSQARGLANISVHESDAQHITCVEAGSCDAAYARWVLCFVRDPGALIASAARAIKRGGALMISDYFNYESLTLAPRSDVFDRVVGAVGRSWRDRGGDPDVVAKLPALFDAHGFDLRDIRVVVRVARPGHPMWQWPTSFFRNYVPELVKSGHLSASDGEAFAHMWTRRSDDPHSFLQTPPVYDIVAVRR